MELIQRFETCLNSSASLGKQLDLIERMIEDLSELNEETIKEIEEARREIESGKFVTYEQLKKDLGL